MSAMRMQTCDTTACAQLFSSILHHAWRNVLLVRQGHSFQISREQQRREERGDE